MRFRLTTRVMVASLFSSASILIIFALSIVEIRRMFALEA